MNRQSVGDYFFKETEDLIDKLCDDFEVTVRNVSLTIHRADGSSQQVALLLRIDTPD